MIFSFVGILLYFSFGLYYTLVGILVLGVRSSGRDCRFGAPVRLPRCFFAAVRPLLGRPAHLQKVRWQSVLRFRIRDPVLFPPDPGSGISKQNLLIAVFISYLMDR
jgi:hypothetical protein